MWLYQLNTTPATLKQLEERGEEYRKAPRMFLAFAIHSPVNASVRCTCEAEAYLKRYLEIMQDVSYEDSKYDVILFCFLRNLYSEVLNKFEEDGYCHNRWEIYIFEFDITIEEFIGKNKNVPLEDVILPHLPNVRIGFAPIWDEKKEALTLSPEAKEHVCHKKKAVRMASFIKAINSNGVILNLQKKLKLLNETMALLKRLKIPDLKLQQTKILSNSFAYVYIQDKLLAEQLACFFKFFNAQCQYVEKHKRYIVKISLIKLENEKILGFQNAIKAIDQPISEFLDFYMSEGINVKSIELSCALYLYVSAQNISLQEYNFAITVASALNQFPEIIPSLCSASTIKHDNATILMTVLIDKMASQLPSDDKEDIEARSIVDFYETSHGL